MKEIIKNSCRQIVALLMLITYLNTFADIFNYDGINYASTSDTTAIVIYNSNQYIGDIVIPERVPYNGKIYTVIAIHDEAFRSCRQLTSVTMPNSITSIGVSAFYYCNGLTSITLPNRLKEIGGAAFSHCTSLKSVIIPDSVTSIGAYAFSECSSLNSITISKNVTDIGQSAFFGCRGLHELIWNARNCTSNGQMYTNNIEYVTIGSDVQVIPDYFVENSQITEIIIPRSVTNIGVVAFYGCQWLSKVTVLSELPPTGHMNMFPVNQLIYVPNATSYKNVSYWKDYNIQNSFSITAQLTRAKVIADDLFNLDKVVLSDSTGHVMNTVSSTDKKSIILTNLIPNTIYKLDLFIFYEQDEYEIRTEFITKTVSIHSKSTSITQTTITPSFIVNCDEGFLLDLCGVEMDSTVYNGIITETTGNSFSFECRILGLLPETNYKIRPLITHNGIKYYGSLINLKTNRVTFSSFLSTSTTQTTLNPTFTVSRDESFIVEECGVESNQESYIGNIIEIKENSYIIECLINGLTPNNNYILRPWVKYKGVKYYGDYKTFKTASINVNNDIILTPTSAHITGSYLSGDATVTDAYFIFNGENMNALYQTGLNPSTSYSYTYTVETTCGNQVNNYSFYTPALTMLAQPVKMLTNTTVMFEAETNMIDEETMVGFEWRRYDAPNEMPSTQVYSPVFGGKIAGILKNLAENVYYKYRPFYTSNSGKSYYGNWVAFLTADAGVVYEPIVYTYNSPAVTQTEATLQGVALRGSEDITEQGFEYWKSGNGNVTKVTATGERMSKKVSGLQSGSKYIFRAFLTAGGETHYGNEVEFVTLSNSLDVNIDGEINIADINAVIDMILTDNQVSSGDVNGDGEVNIADINTIIDAILSN